MAGQQGTLKVIWFGLVASCLIYAVLAWTIITEPSYVPVPEVMQQPPVSILYLLALFALAAAVFVPRFLTVRRVALIVRWALLESMVIFGLLGAILTRTSEVILPPLLLALAAFLTSFPANEADERHA